jgi:ABC-2 type transport system permease protein
MSRKRKDIGWLLIALLGLVFANAVFSRLFFRVDFTSEGRYSLSDSTISMLRNMEEPAIITVYLEGSFPPGFKRLQIATRELLEEFRYQAGNNIQYRFVDPFSGKDPEEQALMQQELVEKGIQPFSLTFADETGRQERSIIPAATISYRGHEAKVDLLEELAGLDPSLADQALNTSIERLEFGFASALYKLHTFENRPKIAFSFGHGELPQGLIADFLISLKDYYTVEGIVLNNQLNALNKSYSCLVIAKPDSLFKDAEKFVIDQYIMRGGRVLWLLDQVNVDLDSLRTSPKGYTIALPKDVGLNDLLFKYGVRINYNLIQDASCAPIPVVTGMVGDRPKEELLPWFFYPVVLPDDRHVLTSRVGPIRFEFPSSLDTVKVQGIEKTILLNSGPVSRSLMTPARVGLQSVTEKASPERFNSPNQPMAVLLEGKFESAFKGRLLPTSDYPFVERGQSSKMIVVGDGDVIKNRFNSRQQRPFKLGEDPASGFFFEGNKNFLMNAVHYLANDAWFIAIRNKRFQMRNLDPLKVESNGKFWQMVQIILPVIYIFLLWFGVQWIQKRNYA